MTKQFGFLMDTSLCVECQACRVACQMQNQLPHNRTLIRFRFQETGSYPAVTNHITRITCMHCQLAPCVKICPTGALVKGENTLTYLAPERCSGCGYCAQICPFKVPQALDNRSYKCMACRELVEEGKEPVCVSTCIANALKFGERAELLKSAEKRVAALQKTFPNAQIYGREQMGGLGMLLILRDDPAVYGLPVAPRAAGELAFWKDSLQPTGFKLVGAALLATGASYAIASRNHRRELSEE